MEGWNIAETDFWKVADSIFFRDGKLPIALKVEKTNPINSTIGCKHVLLVCLRT